MGKARMRIDSRVLQMAEDKKKGVLYIYDTVQNDGYDWWNGEKIVSETSEAFIRDRLAEMGAVEELDIHISSSGGSVKVGLGIYSQIKSFGCPRKVAYIDGMAASIATVIAMAADEVVMQNAGLMMIHDAWIEYTSGNAKELRKEADDLDVITSASKTAYLEHSKGKITEEQLTAFMDAESCGSVPGIWTVRQDRRGRGRRRGWRPHAGGKNCVHDGWRGAGRKDNGRNIHAEKAH